MREKPTQSKFILEQCIRNPWLICLLSEIANAIQMVEALQGQLTMGQTARSLPVIQEGSAAPAVPTDAAATVPVDAPTPAPVDTPTATPENSPA
jgi:hypothetical protein